jgi:fatty-acid desaturase
VPHPNSIAARADALRSMSTAAPPPSPPELVPIDLVALAITYVLTGLGIAVGFHRVLTPRNVKTTRKHHAFPTSARHGLRRRELDPGAWLISGLERCHLAWDVVRISPGRQQAKRGSAAP